MTPRSLVPVTAGPGLDDALALALDRALDGTGPALLLLPDGPEGGRLLAALSPAVADGVPAGTAVVVATSGSTGEPRGVRIGRAELEWSAAATHAHLGGPGQWLQAVSPARIAGLQVLVRSRLAGIAPVALRGAFTPAAFAAAAARLEPGVRRYTALVPTQLHRLLDASVPLDAFDAILLGGAAIPTALLLRARAAGTRVVRTYGMTETCGGCVYDGRPLPGVRVEVVDPARQDTPFAGSVTSGQGLIRLAGPMLARGYLGPEQGGFRAGWFLTSDLGRLDGAATGNGTLNVVGRADDVIVTGGSNVAAQSVESALAEHPAVAAAAVAGRPDEEWGEIVVAVVVPAAGAAVDARELRTHVGELLGWPYAPRDVLLADALPLLASGKLDRGALRALVRTPG